MNFGWDYKVPRSESDFRYVETKCGVRCIRLSPGSIVYHGYKGDRPRVLDIARTSNITHGNGDTRAETEDLNFFCRTTFSWLDVLDHSPTTNHFEANDGTAFFCAPRADADFYGSKRISSLIVHKNAEKNKPLYQLTSANGSTICFKTVRPIYLLNLSDPVNVRSLLKFIGGDQYIRVSAMHEGPIREGFMHIIRDSMNAVYTENNKVIRRSEFEKDAHFMLMVQKWLSRKHLSRAIRGTFWGGSKWSTFDRGYGAQEFAFFRPSLDLVHVDHTRPRRPYSFPGVPTYEEYLAAGGKRDSLKTMLPRLGGPGELSSPSQNR